MMLGICEEASHIKASSKALPYMKVYHSIKYVSPVEIVQTRL